MKFKNYLESIKGVGIYPVITLLMFFILFTALTIWVLRARKSQYLEVSELPLQDGEILNDPIIS